jgi:hypothetical protein
MSFSLLFTHDTVHSSLEIRNLLTGLAAGRTWTGSSMHCAIHIQKIGAAILVSNLRLDALFGRSNK